MCMATETRLLTLGVVKIKSQEVSSAAQLPLCLSDKLHQSGGRFHSLSSRWTIGLNLTLCVFRAHPGTREKAIQMKNGQKSCHKPMSFIHGEPSGVRRLILLTKFLDVLVPSYRRGEAVHDNCRESYYSQTHQQERRGRSVFWVHSSWRQIVLPILPRACLSTGRVMTPVPTKS